jgi:hypothetical protein
MLDIDLIATPTSQLLIEMTSMLGGFSIVSIVSILAASTTSWKTATIDGRTPLCSFMCKILMSIPSLHVLWTIKTSGYRQSERPWIMAIQIRGWPPLMRL